MLSEKTCGHPTCSTLALFGKVGTKKVVIVGKVFDKKCGHPGCGTRSS